MKGILGIVGGILAVPLLCGAAVIVLYVMIVALTIPKLPAWAQPGVESWMLGTPMPLEVYVDGGLLVGRGMVAVGSKAYDGYSGAESFICGNLMPDAAFVGGVTYITDVFGVPRMADYNHSGIDIGTNYQQGLPVRTPMGGKVVFAGPYGGWGYAIIIENNGYQVLLSHASEMMLNGNILQPEQIVGQVVQAGDVVMTSGGANKDWRDGSSSGAHIHFEIRQCSPKTNECSLAVDPMTAMLPGQAQTCNWHQQVSDPSLNVSEAR